jgi:hypothetical protein
MQPSNEVVAAILVQTLAQQSDAIKGKIHSAGENLESLASVLVPLYNEVLKQIKMDHFQARAQRV